MKADVVRSKERVNRQSLIASFPESTERKEREGRGGERKEGRERKGGRERRGGEGEYKEERETRERGRGRKGGLVAIGGTKWTVLF